MRNRPAPIISGETATLKVPTTSPHLLIKPNAKIVDITAEQRARLMEFNIGVQIVFSNK